MMIEPKNIIRTRRKSIALVVNSQGDLVVRAPYYVSQRMIMEFVTHKQSWIAKQQKRVETENAKFIPTIVAPGGIIQYGGTLYRIDMENVEEITICGNSVLLPKNTGEEQLCQWLRKQAIAVLTKQVVFYAARMQVTFKKLRLSNAKTRWGSCSFYNVLSFSWRLIMCPPEVLDYVVVHELCHIHNKSHNKLFWQQVELVLPNYRNSEQWLKNNRKIMEIL